MPSRNSYFLLVTTLLPAMGGKKVEAQVPAPISLDQAISLARSNSPATRSAQANFEAALDRVKEANTEPNPQITLADPWALNHTEVPTAGFDEGLLISQTIELGGKRGARVRAARGEAVAAASDDAAATVQLDFNVRSAYYAAQAAVAQREADQDTLTVAQAFLSAAQARLKVGDVARYDELRAEAEVDRDQATLAQDQGAETNALESLRSLTGAPAIKAEQLEKPAYAPLTYKLIDLSNWANAHRLDVRSANSLISARAGDLGTARAAGRPDAFIEARRYNFNDVPEGESLRFGLTMPLFDWGHNRAAAAEARAALDQQTAVTAETERTAALDVVTTWTTAVTDQLVVESFNNGRLDRARQLLDMARIGYDHGANSYLDVLDAQDLYRSETSDYAKALAAYLTALADLQRALGGSYPAAP